MALVLTGEEGIGKTTLWGAVLSEAEERGFRVLWARPVESEAAPSFAAVGDLLRDSFRRGGALPTAPQRSALAALLAATGRGSRTRGPRVRVPRQPARLGPFSAVDHRRGRRAVAGRASARVLASRSAGSRASRSRWWSQREQLPMRSRVHSVWMSAGRRRGSTVCASAHSASTCSDGCSWRGPERGSPLGAGPDPRGLGRESARAWSSRTSSPLRRPQRKANPGHALALSAARH